MTVTEIYLDHAATTPVAPDVIEAMIPYLGDRYGNPSSIYARGREARAGLDQARGLIANVLNCQAREIVFTGGGTESDNLAIKGVAWWHRLRNKGNHIVTTSIEHHAVLHSAEFLQQFGFDVTFVQPDPDGIIQPEAVERVLRDDTVLVSVMYANNEIGTIQPISAIGEIVRSRDIVMHTDAVQAGGTLDLDVDHLNVDMLSLSAHKFYGPKGVGLLYVRRQTPILWQQSGGAQENNHRAGTENVAGIVGMAKAIEIAEAGRVAENRRLTELRQRLIEGITARVSGSMLNGHPEQRLPNNANISFHGVEGETLLLNLDMNGIAASSGSACTTGSTEPSHVLSAIGLTAAQVNGSLRLTLGKSNDASQVGQVVDVLEESVARLRRMAAAPAD